MTDYTPISLEQCYFNKKEKFIVIPYSLVKSGNWNHDCIPVRSHVTGIEFAYKYDSDYGRATHQKYFCWKLVCQDSKCPVKILYMLDDDSDFHRKFPNFELKDFEP